MERQLELSELSVISWASAVEGCPLSRVPLYNSPISLIKITKDKVAATIDKLLTVLQ